MTRALKPSFTEYYLKQITEPSEIVKCKNGDIFIEIHYKRNKIISNVIFSVLFFVLVFSAFISISQKRTDTLSSILPLFVIVTINIYLQPFRYFFIRFIPTDIKNGEDENPIKSTFLIAPIIIIVLMAILYIFLLVYTPEYLGSIAPYVIVVAMTNLFVIALWLYHKTRKSKKHTTKSEE